MPRLISLCFDDALARQIYLAEELDVPVTFSIPTKLIGSAAHFMNWEQVCELSRRHEIACHSHDHDAWTKGQVDVASDIETSMQAFAEHGIVPTAFVPPRNEWIESPVLRERFFCGRKGDGQLLPDLMRLKAFGLSRLPPSDVDNAINFNKPRNWAVYVAHLYRVDGQPDPVYGDEWSVVRSVVEKHKRQGARFVTLSGIAEEFKKELSAIYEHCPICGSTVFEDFATRKRAKCTGCGALERHRDLAYLIDSKVIDVAGKRGLLVSSGEMLKPLQRNGAEVTLISQFRPPPYNDVHDLSHLKDFDFALLQHVLPFVDDHLKAIQQIMLALKPDGVIYANHPVDSRLASHQPRQGAYGLHFSDGQWTRSVARLGMTMERFPILPGSTDQMFVIRRS